jgi:asparagine synthase (glutamine-hydrolysing)
VCGIAGIAYTRLAEDDARAALGRMSDALKHRGPDDSALCLYPAAHAGFAFRRLALVDLVTGNQPITNEDETLHLVVNGEIYNHRELRRELESTGHRFRTSTDIEVILHLYEEHGTSGFRRLNGMFGLAILDARSGRLVLARDRSGMKPLYYASTPSGFVFASEPRALFASSLVEKAPDWDALDTYLAVGYTPAPRTCFQGVRKLKAGHCLLLEDHAIREETYWSLQYQKGGPRSDEREYAEELERLLRAAVRSHLDADVPVGAFVSGGWDSSLVGLMAAQTVSPRLKTFSIVFPDHPAADESPYSRLFAARAATDHHEIEFRAEDIPRILPAVARHLGEPCLASPCLLLYQLSSLAASSVKAVVGGEGSDEQFAGYHWLQARSELYYWLRRVAPRGPFRYASGHINHLQLGRLSRILAAPDHLSADAEWYRVFSPAERRRLFIAGPSQERPDTLPLRLDPETGATCRNHLERRLALEFTRRLPEGILLVADRMSMAHSLEVRMPFLDSNILEFSAALPARMRRRGRQEKYVLSLLKGLLPEGIAKRRKFGLVAPMKRYLAGPLRNWARETLLDSSCLGGQLDRAKLESMLAGWIDGSDAYARRPWSLILLQAWWDQYFSH